MITNRKEAGDMRRCIGLDQPFLKGDRVTRRNFLCVQCFITYNLNISAVL
jgi:formate-dependent nitrite reductase cytochrome c552 subunit